MMKKLFGAYATAATMLESFRVHLDNFILTRVLPAVEKQMLEKVKVAKLCAYLHSKADMPRIIV